jgi:hypothetical protein
MAKTPKNHGKDWTNKDVSALRRLAGQNTPTRVIALKLGRSPESVYQKAHLEDISLRPTNQSPYNRREK